MSDLTTWQITLTVPQALAPGVEAVLEGLGGAMVTSHEGESRQIDLYVEREEAPDGAALTALLHESLGAEVDAPAVSRVVERDWVAESQSHFPMLEFGRFLVYGSHHARPRAYGRLPLLIDAGRAFGTGHHDSTALALLLLERLQPRYRQPNLLDLGCGSGILALAALRLWPGASVLAADIDPQSVAVAQENRRINRIAGDFRAVASNGLRQADLRGAAPYDLILANILTRPLLMMAPEIARALAPGGYLILAGFLEGDRVKLEARYRALGLALVARQSRGGWSALLLRKR